MCAFFQLPHYCQRTMGMFKTIFFAWIGGSLLLVLLIYLHSLIEEHWPRTRKDAVARITPPIQ